VTAIREPRVPAVLAMRPDLAARLFSGQAQNRLSTLTSADFSRICTDFHDPGFSSLLRNAEILVTGWECPRVDSAVLDAAPRLRAVVHAGGSVKDHLDAEVWRRGIAVSSAVEANSIPVAEFTLAVITLAGKDTWSLISCYRDRRSGIDRITEFPDIGNYHRTVGIVGASRIGRRVIAGLRHSDLDVLVHDPYLSESDAAGLGAELVDLDELVARAEIVSLHAPSTPATRYLIDRRRLALMRDGSTLINTARGALVDHDALLEVLLTGRIRAVLDTTTPEVLPADSPLYDLPNVVLTPHIAGAGGRELHRLGWSAVEEVERLINSQSLLHAVSTGDLPLIA
jgi:phosphoglycerate dehydrogenase-like enzyme